MLLEIKDLNTFYEQSHILQGVSLGIDRGEIVCLLGRNGVGKTTTLKSVIGFLKLRSGQVLFKGQNVAGFPPHAIAKLGVGFVPEDRRIFPTLTVRENLIMGIKPGQKSDEDAWTTEKVYKYFPALQARDKQKGGHLSGGEQQMLTIARTLMGNPEVLLIDEPTEGLAPKIVETVEQVIQDIHQHDIPILLVEQNMRVALRLAGRIYVMSKGKIVFQGTSQELKEAHEVRQKYLEV
ncbi:MAG: ABC transporter ATP-binding protein [Deltaproteobacteria bacterium RBG_13_51_10]|jgi:branched-chain amino acid transport system ATP-binding protein|nr:MAG: ABC transporter ATP-binding protein [Deltaproteobacteria bacterium RBG_13_51_10]